MRKSDTENPKNVYLGRREIFCELRKNWLLLPALLLYFVISLCETGEAENASFFKHWSPLSQIQWAVIVIACVLALVGIYLKGKGKYGSDMLPVPQTVILIIGAILLFIFIFTKDAYKISLTQSNIWRLLGHISLYDGLGKLTLNKESKANKTWLAIASVIVVIAMLALDNIAVGIVVVCYMVLLLLLPVLSK
jgi:hypothetical protein